MLLSLFFIFYIIIIDISGLMAPHTQRGWCKGQTIQAIGLCLKFWYKKSNFLNLIKKIYFKLVKLVTIIDVYFT